MSKLYCRNENYIIIIESNFFSSNDGRHNILSVPTSNLLLGMCKKKNHFYFPSHHSQLLC